MQTRIYQIAYVPPEETTLGADVGEGDTTIELADGQNIQTSGETYLYVGGEFMLIQGIGYEPRFVDVVRGALGTEAQSHRAGEKVFEGEIDPSGSGTDERELRHVDEINNPDIKSLGDIEQSLEYEKAKFRISNTSVSLYDLPKNRLRDAGSIYHPWVVEILDGASNIIFSGIIDGSSVTFNAESRITSFDVLSWLEIMDRAGAVPSRDIYETSIRASRKSNSENAFFEYPGKGVQIQINDDALPADVATENDVGVIEGDNNEVREFVSLKKSADEVDGDFPVVLLSTSNEGSDDRVVRRFPPTGESSKFNIELLPTASSSGPGTVYGFNYTDTEGVRELAEIAGTDLSDLSSGLAKKVDLPNGYSVEFELTYTFTNGDGTTETVTRQEEITSLGFAMKEDAGPVVELFQGSQTAGGTFIKSIEGNDGGLIRVKRDSATAIVQNLEGGDTIRFLDQNIYGYEGRILDVASQDIFNGDYAPRELLDSLFSIEARGTDNRRRLGVLPEVFTGAYKESNQALHNIDGRAQLPSDPLKAVRQIQQKGRFLLKESFTNRTNVDGDPIPGYGVDLILRNNFFDTAEEVSKRKVKSWEEDVATDTVRGVIIRPNEDYFSGRAGPDVDERIGFYFEGIEQYEDPQADDLRERMTPPEGRNVIEIEMPALPSDNVGAIYSGGDSVVENNPRLKEIARFYYEHFRKGAREVNLTFGNDDPEWLGGYYYFKNQGAVIDDYVFVLQETKNVDSTSIDTQIKGRIGADAVDVISSAPTAIIRGPQDISRADSEGNVEVVLRGEDSYSLADNPLRYKWERKPSGGSYSTAQSEGPILKDSLSGVDSQREYVYKLTVTDERTGKTDSVTHTLTVGPGQDRPLPGAASDEFSVRTWQQDGKGYLEVDPVSRVGLDFVRARKRVGGNIEQGQSFSEVSQLSISPQSVDTAANSVVLADDYKEHFAGKPRVYFQRSNGSYAAFDLSSVSYDSNDDKTTLSLAESISSTDVDNVLSGGYIVTVGLTTKHTSAIEVQTRGVLTEKRTTLTKTFDFNNLAEVDASVYNDESGAVYADVSGDEDTDNYDVEYRKNGGAWQSVLSGQTNDIVGYEVISGNNVSDGDQIEVRITPYNAESETGETVTRATFYNRSSGGDSQLDSLVISGAGTIDSINTGEFRFLDASGNDAAVIDTFGLQVDKINGVSPGNYARTDQAETFSQDVTVQGNLTVNGTEFITNTETVEIQDNLAVINNGETGSGITEGFSGWEVDRGTLTDYFFGFDEGRDRFVVGEGTTGRQVVATREDPGNITPDGIAVFNSTANRFDTEQQGSAGTVNVDQLHGYTGDKYPRKAENASIGGKWTFTDDVTLDGAVLQTQNAATGFSGSGVIIDDVESWFEDLQVRGSLIAREFELRKITVTKGDHVFGPGGGKIEEVTGFGPYTLTFAEPSGLQPDDLCLIQESSLSDGDRTIIKQVELFVDSTANQTKEVTVSVNGTGTPEKGDDVVVVGSQTDTTRDSSVFLSPYGPYIDALDGINSFSEWNNRTPKARFGKIDGAPDLSAGPSPSGHGLWAKNAYLEGTIVANNGQIANTVTIGGTDASDLASLQEAQDKVDSLENAIYGQAADEGTTIIDGGTIVTSLINTNEIAVGDLSDGSDYATLTEAQNKVNSLENTIYGQTSDEGTTLIDGGTIVTDLINTDQIAVSDLSDGSDYATLTEAQNKVNSLEDTIYGQTTDEGTTLIDGGQIVTNLIAANEIAVGDLSDGGSYATLTEAQNKADAAESNAESYADGLDQSVRNDLQTTFENAVANGNTIIDGGVIATDLVTTDSVAFTPTDSSNIVATINASSEGLEIDASKLGITASDLTINATDVEFSPVESNEVIVAINNSNETVNINSDKLKIDSSTTFASGYDPSTKLESSDLPDSSVTIRDSSEPPSRPDGSALEDGDIWIDTSDGNNPHVYDGPSDQWVRTYTNIDGGDITTGTVDANRIDVDGIFATNATITSKLEMGSNGKIFTEQPGSTDLAYEITESGFYVSENNEIIWGPNKSDGTIDTTYANSVGRIETVDLGTANYFTFSGQEGAMLRGDGLANQVAVTTSGIQTYGVDIVAADQIKMNPDKYGSSGKVRVEGDLNYTGSLNSVSDRQAKENISPISNPLDKVSNLGGRVFTKNGTVEAGFIAQDVNWNVPRRTMQDYEGLNYTSFHGLWAEAIKELKAEIDRLRGRVKTLE